MEKNISLATFIAADCGDRVAAHALRMDTIRHHLIAAVKGNATEWMQAIKEVNSRKAGTLVKAYKAAFQATGTPAKASYDGKCTDAVMQAKVLPVVNEVIAVWENEFTKVFPVEIPEKSDEEKAKSKADRKARRTAAGIEAAKAAGYVLPSELTADTALPAIKAALPVLEISQLEGLLPFINALVEEKTLTATAAAKEAGKAVAKAKAPRKAKAKTSEPAPVKTVA